jgi:hypothetical protein
LRIVFLDWAQIALVIMHAGIKLAKKFKIFWLSFNRLVSLVMILNTYNFLVPVHRKKVSCLDNSIASFNLIFNFVEEVRLTFPRDVF